MLCATFRIAPTFDINDLCEPPDLMRYRIVCRGMHQNSGILLGDGVGSCSSNEENYKWRKAYGQKEFEHTPESRRRMFYKYNDEIMQVRQDAFDMDNTVLKMASKRAMVAMTLGVLAASDMFTQDGDGGSFAGARPPPAAPPANTNPDGHGSGETAAQEQKETGEAVTPGQKSLLESKCANANIDESQLCDHMGVTAIAEILKSKVNDALTWVKENEVPYRD